MNIVPANEATWDDLEAVLGGASCHGGRCYGQRAEITRPTLRRAVLRIDF